MLKPALRIAAVLAALMSPSLASAQSYELLHDEADQRVRAVCFDRKGTREYLAALHFQMEVLGKDHRQAARAVRHRMGGNGDLDCYFLRASASFPRPPIIIDIVELDGLAAWTDLQLYGVEARAVANEDGTVYTRQHMGDDVYVVVSGKYVRKRP